MADYVDADAIMAMLEPERFVEEPRVPTPGGVQYEEVELASFPWVPPGYSNPAIPANPPVYANGGAGVPNRPGGPVYSVPNLGPAAGASVLSGRGEALAHNGRGALKAPDPRTVPLRGLADPSHANEEALGVKYIRDRNKLRYKYQLELGSTMLRRGEIFDTARIKAAYLHKLGRNIGDRLTPEEKAKPFPVKQRAQIGAAMLGRTPAESSERWKALGREWGLESLIWVCAPDMGSKTASFYSHIGKIHRFHHSSFQSGGGVIGAGEWIVKQGKLLKISANSGHYRPPLEFLHRSVLYMAEAWHVDTVVLLWNVPKDSWEEVPVLRFRDNPSGGGTYKAHPAG